MKYVITPLLLIFFAFFASGQQASKKKSASRPTGIHWVSLEEAQEQMKVVPKKVYIDIYTDWCGWCKVMEKKTFANQKVTDYLNEHFYAVRLNAETADSLFFKGKKYGRLEGSSTNELAAEFMQNKLSYPTSIFFDEQFTNPQPVPGYLDIPTIEMILTYIGDNQHKKVPFDQFKDKFKGTW